MAKGVSRWIKNLLRIYQVDKKHKNLFQWIEKAVEQEPINFNGSRSCRDAIEKAESIGKFLDGLRIC